MSRRSTPSPTDDLKYALAPVCATAPLQNLSLKDIQPTSTEGWAQRASFTVQFTLMPRVDVKDPAIDIELKNTRGTKPMNSDWVLCMVLADLTKTQDRGEIGGQLATMVEKALGDLAGDRTGQQLFGGLATTDFNHNCQPWRSTKSFAWFTTSAEQRDFASALFKGRTLNDLVVAAFGPDGTELELQSGAGKDTYKRTRVPNKTFTYTFRRANVDGPMV